MLNFKFTRRLESYFSHCLDTKLDQRELPSAPR